VKMPLRGISILTVLGAYLLGAVPFGWIVGRIAGGMDVRRLGSGNIGATNVARSLGAWAGVMTLGLDVGKGAGAVWAAGALTGQPETAVAAGLAAIAGHVFPVYLGFRGGKGVATGLGAFLVLEPVATLWAAGIFLGTVAISRRVSPGSILAAASLPAILYLRGASASLTLAGLLSSVLIIIRHGENLRRIAAGTEPRLGGGR
jgi:glycerol-3-phosphate acyltransferase PlsY